MPALDLVLPCYNPEAGWKEIIIYHVQELRRSLPQTDLYVFIINDGSIKGITPDDLAELKQIIPNLRYLTYQKNKGKGYALRAGIQATSHEHCIYTDVDFPYTMHSIKDLYNALLGQESDIVIGSRDNQYYRHLNQNRAFISKLLRLINQHILRLPTTDTQCGLKGFNQKGRILFLRTKLNRYLFDLEFILLAAKNPQIKLRVVPVELRAGIVVPKLNWKILLSEVPSLLKITFSKTLESFSRRR